MTLLVSQHDVQTLKSSHKELKGQAINKYILLAIALLISSDLCAFLFFSVTYIYMYRIVYMFLFGYVIVWLILKLE